MCVHIPDGTRLRALGPWLLRTLSNMAAPGQQRRIRLSRRSCDVCIDHMGISIYTVNVGIGFCQIDTHFLSVSAYARAAHWARSTSPGWQQVSRRNEQMKDIARFSHRRASVADALAQTEFVSSSRWTSSCNVEQPVS